MASLRDLGLSEYESKAYRSLLSTGPTTAKELSRASGVPMGRIYDILNSIEQHNLVRSQAASRPKKYVAVEPNAALERLLEEKKRDLEEKAEQYESIVDELAEELDAADPGDEQFWTAAVGPTDSMDLLLERIDAADESVVMVAADPSPQIDVRMIGEAVQGHLDAALDRDVSVNILISWDLVSSLPRSVGQWYREAMQDREHLSVRTSQDITSTFNIIDDVEVCIQVPNPLPSEEIFGMVDLKDAEFTAQVQETFRPHWEEGHELRL